jgi:hypothetical protein
LWIDSCLPFQDQPVHFSLVVHQRFEGMLPLSNRPFGALDP